MRTAFVVGVAVVVAVVVALASSCDRAASGCNAKDETTLSGVHVRFPNARCRFTLVEAAAGIDIAYVISADGDVGVVNDPINCKRPGENGLIVLEHVDGNGQYYGLDDTGRCAPASSSSLSSTVPKGDHATTFRWPGFNWHGPSDDGAKPGPAFPPGDYTLTVSAAGSKGGAPFVVKGSLPITLVK